MAKEIIRKNGRTEMAIKAVGGLMVSVGTTGLSAGAYKAFAPKASNPLMLACQFVAALSLEAALTYTAVDAMNRSVDETIDAINNIGAFANDIKSQTKPMNAFDRVDAVAQKCVKTEVDKNV